MTSCNGSFQTHRTDTEVTLNIRGIFLGSEVARRCENKGSEDVGVVGAAGRVTGAKGEVSEVVCGRGPGPWRIGGFKSVNRPCDSSSAVPGGKVCDVQIASAEVRDSTDASSPNSSVNTTPQEDISAAINPDIPAAMLLRSGTADLNSLPSCLPLCRYGREARPGTVRLARRFPDSVAPPRRGPIVIKQ